MIVSRKKIVTRKEKLQEKKCLEKIVLSGLIKDIRASSGSEHGDRNGVTLAIPGLGTAFFAKQTRTSWMTS